MADTTTARAGDRLDIMRYLEMLNDVKDRDEIRNYIDSRYGECLWYAWGYRDALMAAGIETSLNLDDGFAFAVAQMRAALDFKLEKTHSLTSILDAWQEYLRARTP